MSRFDVGLLRDSAGFGIIICLFGLTTATFPRDILLMDGVSIVFAQFPFGSKRSHEWIEPKRRSDEDRSSNVGRFRDPSIFLATSLLGRKKRLEWVENDTGSTEYQRFRKDVATLYIPAVVKTLELMTSDEHVERLIPGLPDDITLALIIPKLSYEDAYNLSAVSSDWLQAIHDRRVYDARVTADSTETLVVINQMFSERNDTRTIALCSMRENALYELPSIPGVYRGVPEFSQCLSLHSKLYLMGGEKDHPVHYEDFPDSDFPVGSKEVYVLDLAGDKRQWKACASMQEPRLKFGAAVMDGKIYVFGGTSHGKPCGSEVYDPEVDAWNSIKPMRFLRSNSEVSIIGEELFVHGGEFLDQRPPSSDCSDRLIHPLDSSDDDSDEEYIEEREGKELFCRTENSLLTEVYRPLKNEWKFAKPLGGDFGEIVFRAHGRFHLMTRRNIYVQDVKRHLWTFLQSHSFPAVGPTHSRRIEVPFATLAVGHCILTLVHWEDGIGHQGLALLRSRGFRNGNKKILWESIDLSPPSSYSLPLHKMIAFNMCTIQV